MGNFLGFKDGGCGWLFQTMLPCCIAKKDRRMPGVNTSGGGNVESEVICNWVVQAVLAVLLLVTALPLVLVLGTGLRTRKLLSKLNSRSTREAYSDGDEWNPRAVRIIWAQFGSLLVDLVFLPLALVVLFSGWGTLLPLIACS